MLSSIKHSSLPKAAKYSLGRGLFREGNTREEINSSLGQELVMTRTIVSLSRYLSVDGTDGNYLNNFNRRIIPALEDYYNGT